MTRDCPLQFRRGGGESFSQNPKKSAKLRQVAVCGMSYSVRVNGKSEWILFFFISSLFNHNRVFLWFFLNLISIFLFIIFFLSKKLSKVNCQLVISFFSLGKWKSYEAFISDFVLFKKKKIIVFLLQLNYRCSQIFRAVLFFNSFTALLKILCTKIFWRYARRKMILCVTYLGNLFNSTLRKFVPYESFQSLYIKEINKYM